MAKLDEMKDNLRAEGNEARAEQEGNSYKGNHEISLSPISIWNADVHVLILKTLEDRQPDKWPKSAKKVGLGTKYHEVAI